MNILKAPMKKLYRDYLFLALGSSLVVSVYTMVDAIAIGQYEGPAGAAALATVAPIWTMMFSFGLFFGVGGSILMSARKGAYIRLLSKSFRKNLRHS